MWGGELFVPKIPSYKILDLAEAIAPEAEKKIVGIRPGEKLHEEMITKTDSYNTLEFPNHFVILPSTPLWDIKSFSSSNADGAGKLCEEGFTYNSGTNDVFLNINEIKELLLTLDNS